MELRPHPLYIWYDARKWIWLLVIPVLRAVFSPRDAVFILLSSIRDLGIALLLIGYSTVKWRGARYRLHNGITLEQGLLFHRKLRVVAEDAASIEMERSPFMWAAGGRRVRVNTAGLRRRADATLYLPAREARRLLGSAEKRAAACYKARIWPITVLAASGSNAAVGLLSLAPAARQISYLLGQQVPDKMYSLVDKVLSLGLPPLLNSIANLLVLSWGAAFVGSWLRNVGFTASRAGDQLYLSSGLLTRRHTVIDSRKVTALELRQTLFMRIFRLYTATITAAGYGREKGARPVVVPAARARDLSAALDGLMPDYPICSSFLRPKFSQVLRFIGLPLGVMAGAIVPLWLGGVWKTAAVLWIVGSGWWLLVRLAGFQWSGFGVGSDAVTMRYSRGLALYAVHVPLEVADCAILTQSPWQKRAGICTVELRCFGEKHRRHRVWALPYTQAKTLVERIR